MQIAGFLSIDLKPVLFFLPEKCHLTFEGGPTFNIAYDLDQNLNDYPNIDFPKDGQEIETNYSGLGANVGLNIQYCMSFSS